MFEAHTGVNLKEVLAASLDQWHLDAGNQVAITTDSSTNITLACKLLGWQRLPVPVSLCMVVDDYKPCAPDWLPAVTSSSLSPGGVVTSPDKDNEFDKTFSITENADLTSLRSKVERTTEEVEKWWLLEILPTTMCLQYLLIFKEIM